MFITRASRAIVLDEALLYALYRKLMPLDRWAEEVLFQAGAIAAPRGIARKRQTFPTEAIRL